jgi:hypothetical protein
LEKIKNIFLSFPLSVTLSVVIGAGLFCICVWITLLLPGPGTHTIDFERHYIGVPPNQVLISLIISVGGAVATLATLYKFLRKRI